MRESGNGKAICINFLIDGMGCLTGSRTEGLEKGGAEAIAKGKEKMGKIIVVGERVNFGANRAVKPVGCGGKG